MPKLAEDKQIARNKKAEHDYIFLERFEAGIVLLGTEVKSCREGKVNFKDSYAGLKNNELFLFNLHIAPYFQANRFNHNPERQRKLLLHRSELKKLIGKIVQRGLTIVPTRIYIKNNRRIKVELALVRQKRQYDKREDIAKKETDRDIARALRAK